MFSSNLRCYFKNHWSNTRLVLYSCSSIIYFMLDSNMAMKIWILKIFDVSKFSLVCTWQSRGEGWILVCVTDRETTTYSTCLGGLQEFSARSSALRNRCASGGFLRPSRSSSRIELFCVFIAQNRVVDKD